MIAAGAVVRVGCAKCRNFFDVDLVAIRKNRGDAYSLIDQTSQCKVTSCRGRCYFFAARSMTDPIMMLTKAGMNPFLVEGMRPVDLEPPAPDEPPPTESAAATA